MEAPSRDNEKEDATKTEDDMKMESWSRRLSETWANIPQQRKSEEKDKIEIESIMERLNSMSSELSSINQQLKKDVLQIPKALKINHSSS